MSTLDEQLRAAGCVYAEEEAALLRAAATTPQHLDTLVNRRVTGTPLEHVLGWAEFVGLRIVVDPGVFVPRRRTELLVRTAAELIAPRAVLVDVCCGSGAVAKAVLDAVPTIEVHACDIDPVATSCARSNLPADAVHDGDLLDALPAHIKGKIDIVVANAPYVPTHEIETMPTEARDHEPLAALDGGIDGLDIHRRLASTAPAWLAPGGRLIVETSAAQAADSARILEQAGFATQTVRDDELDATVVIGLMTP